MVFGIYNWVLIEFVYCILVKNIIVSRLNVYIIFKKDFWFVSPGVMWKGALNIVEVCHYWQLLIEI